MGKFVLIVFQTMARLQKLKNRVLKRLARTCAISSEEDRCALTTSDDYQCDSDKERLFISVDLDEDNGGRALPRIAKIPTKTQVGQKKWILYRLVNLLSKRKTQSGGGRGLEGLDQSCWEETDKEERKEVDGYLIDRLI